MLKYIKLLVNMLEYACIAMLVPLKGYPIFMLILFILFFIYYGAIILKENRILYIPYIGREKGLTPAWIFVRNALIVWIPVIAIYITRLRFHL